MSRISKSSNSYFLFSIFYFPNQLLFIALDITNAIIIESNIVYINVP